MNRPADFDSGPIVHGIGAVASVLTLPVARLRDYSGTYEPMADSLKRIEALPNLAPLVRKFSQGLLARALLFRNEQLFLAPRLFELFEVR